MMNQRALRICSSARERRDSGANPSPPIPLLTQRATRNRETLLISPRRIKNPRERTRKNQPQEQRFQNRQFLETLEQKLDEDHGLAASFAVNTADLVYRLATRAQEELGRLAGEDGRVRGFPPTLAFVSEDLAHTNLDTAGGFTTLGSTGQPVGASITLVTDDVASPTDSATAAGARVYVAPVDKPWGQTVAYVIDPDGILVELATPIASS